MSTGPDETASLHSSPPSGSGTPSASSDDPRTRRSKRSKTGCLTCRLRKKRCDETRPVCAMCTRLGLECLGFSDRRPDWMKKQEVVTDVIAGMKRSVSATNSAKMNAHWADRAAKRLAQEGLPPSTASPAQPPPSQSISPEWNTQTALFNDLSDFLSYPAPQAEMVDVVNTPIPLPAQGQAADVLNNSTQDAIAAQSQSPSPPGGQLIDPAFLTLLGIGTQTQEVQQTFFPLVSQPSSAYGTAFSSSTSDMRYFHHYLTVIMPYQWIFERKVLSDVVGTLAFTNPVVFESLTALAALHMGSKRKRSMAAAQITYVDDTSNTDLAFAETALQRSLHNLRKINFNQFGSQDMVVAAMSVSSFHLFDGGNRKGWTEAVDLCRKSLAAILQGCPDWNCEDPGSKLQLAALVKRLGHLLSPLIWTDILTSVTEGRASQFVSVYRILLLDGQSEDMGDLLKETVMGCDSTTRLAIAETIALSEWKDKALEMGRLSIRELMERATAIELLLAQRRWRERHLFDSNDPLTLQRREFSNIFFHSARVLLAVTVNGCYPEVTEVVSTVRDVVNAFQALDLLNMEGADRALVFPTVIAGCHVNSPALQSFFKDRFLRLGEEAVAFGNTRNALRLMEEVWRRREMALPGEEIHWRKVMFDLDEEGLLLI